MESRAIEQTTNTSSQQTQSITINRKVDTIPLLYKEKGFKNFYAEDRLLDKKQTCLEFAKNELDKKSLVMCGKVGNGKTHLAVAIARNYISNKSLSIMDEIHNRRTIKVRFLDADEYFLTLNDLAITGKSKINYIQEILFYDLIIIDDLGIGNFTPAKQENLYYLINKCYLSNHPLIITTNFSLEQLERIDARIPSRLNEMATILSFDFSDYRITGGMNE